MILVDVAKITFNCCLTYKFSLLGSAPSSKRTLIQSYDTQVAQARNFCLWVIRFVISMLGTQDFMVRNLWAGQFFF